MSAISEPAYYCGVGSENRTCYTDTTGCEPFKHRCLPRIPTRREKTTSAFDVVPDPLLRQIAEFLPGNLEPFAAQSPVVESALKSRLSPIRDAKFLAKILSEGLSDIDALKTWIQNTTWFKGLVENRMAVVIPLTVASHAMTEVMVYRFMGKEFHNLALAGSVISSTAVSVIPRWENTIIIIILYMLTSGVLQLQWDLYFDKPEETIIEDWKMIARQTGLVLGVMAAKVSRFVGQILGASSIESNGEIVFGTMLASMIFFLI